MRDDNDVDGDGMNAKDRVISRIYRLLVKANNEATARLRALVYSNNGDVVEKPPGGPKN